jgi:hypothetical protein
MVIIPITDVTIKLLAVLLRIWVVLGSNIEPQNGFHNIFHGFLQHSRIVARSRLYCKAMDNLAAWCDRRLNIIGTTIVSKRVQTCALNTAYILMFRLKSSHKNCVTKYLIFRNPPQQGLCGDLKPHSVSIIFTTYPADTNYQAPLFQGSCSTINFGE